MPYRKRIALAQTIYWLLLAYVVAALVWWFISLQSQNADMRKYKLIQLEASIDRQHSGYLFEQAQAKIDEDYKKNIAKYIGEGSTFLLLILIGAGFVYRSVRKQFKFQQQQQNFMMAITHELKTPISVARLNLETLQKHQLDPEKQKKLIRMTLEETERLNVLTNNILTSSQLEGGGYKLAKEELDLSDLLKDSLENFRHRYSDRKFMANIDQDVDIVGDPTLIQLLISNLVENAIKYSPKEKPIVAELRLNDSFAELHVKDEGPGISDDEKKRVFEKFYRIGTEATRKTQGTGLGLYLCRKIAEDHNGAIKVVDQHPGGSDFVVTLPAAKN